MTNVRRTVLPLVAAVAVLVVMAWFDTTVVQDAAHQAAQTFDSSGYALVASLGMVVIAGAVLLLASLAWHSRSVVVGIVYAVVGGYFALQLWIYIDVAGQLPDPLATAVVNINTATFGPLNAVGIVGGGMLIAGLAVLMRSVRERTRSVSSAVTADPEEGHGGEQSTTLG